jgi:hypothetical protein
MITNELIAAEDADTVFAVVISRTGAVKLVLVDLDDAVSLEGTIGVRTNGYAILSRQGRQPYLHRELTDAPQGAIVDHANRCKLDNRRSNLRLVTQQQNVVNSGLRSSNRSGFKGVSWAAANRKWAAHIHECGKSRHLGTFVDPVDAARVYDAAVLAVHGNYAVTNRSLGLI